MSASTQADRLAHDQPLLESRHTPLLMAALMGVSVIQFLDMTIANVALPYMQTSLGASLDTISWVLTSFIIAGALVLPLTGWLADRVGSRNLFIGAAIMFVVASMACGTATSLTEMVVFRAIQGAAAAFIGPLSQSILFDITRPSKQAQAMGIWGMAVMIGPISGPVIGGFLTDALDWRWVFFVNLPIGIPAIAILWWLLPSRPTTRRTLDIMGAVILAVALVAFELILDRGHEKHWFESYEIIIEAIVSICAFWMFAVHSMTTKVTLFPGALLRDPRFMTGLAFMFVLGITNVGIASILPTMLENIFGYDTLQTGLLMAPRGVGILLTMFVVNRVISRVDVRVLISVGYVIVAYSLWTMTHWATMMGTGPILFSGFVQGLGLGFIFIPVNLMAFSGIQPAMRTDGSTVMNLFRNVGSSFGISVIVTLLARNMQVSHADIASHVTAMNVPGVDLVSAIAIPGGLGAGAMAIVNGAVTQQAAMVAYLDDFYLLFWLMVACVPLPWLIRVRKARATDRVVLEH